MLCWARSAGVIERGRRQWLDQVAMALWVLGAVDSKLGFGLCKVCNLLLGWYILMLTAVV